MEFKVKRIKREKEATNCDKRHICKDDTANVIISQDMVSFHLDLVIAFQIFGHCRHSVNVLKES